MSEQMTKERPDRPHRSRTRRRDRGCCCRSLIPLGAFAVIGVVLFGFSRVLLSITATRRDRGRVGRGRRRSWWWRRRRDAQAAVERHARSR